MREKLYGWVLLGPDAATIPSFPLDSLAEGYVAAENPNEAIDKIIARSPLVEQMIRTSHCKLWVYPVQGAVKAG